MRGVEQSMVKFNDRMVTDVVQTFWAAMQRGEFITGAAACMHECGEGSWITGPLDQSDVLAQAVAWA
jgi:hypothetical protein